MIMKNVFHVHYPSSIIIFVFLLSWGSFLLVQLVHPAKVYLFQVNNRNANKADVKHAQS